jgi:hypothetical protein
MRNLLIHNPCNEHTRYYRDYNLFWDDLTDELKKTHTVFENRFFEDAHKSKFKIELIKRTKPYLEILECEYVIEDLDNGDFWILSSSDQIGSAFMDEQNNPYLKKVLFSQFIPDQIVSHTKNNFDKYFPWIYFPQNPVDYDLLYEKRKKNNFFIDKLYFKGSKSYRPIIDLINPNILSEQNIMSNNSYFEDLINYKMSLSVGGAANGDLCYRDIEYMSIGIPFIKFDFVSILNPGLIPNYHYISIPIPEDLPIFNGVKKDRLGIEKHAKMIEKKFMEVRENQDFLNFISNNARQYYEKYLSKNSRISHTLNILNL